MCTVLLIKEDTTDKIDYLALIDESLNFFLEKKHLQCLPDVSYEEKVNVLFVIRHNKTSHRTFPVAFFLVSAAIP